MDTNAPRWGRTEHVGARTSSAVDDLLAHLDAAHNLASWLLGNQDQAQDIVQDAYLRAIKSMGNFRGGDLRTWVLAIVRNACFDCLRQSKRAIVEPIDDAVPLAGPEDCDPAVIVQRSQDVVAIRQAIAALPDAIREIVVLREIEGLSYKQVAQIAGVPIGTVMSRLSRGRSRLAQMLSKQCPTPATESEESR